jgi:exodeoxyribonuclease VII small subunit
MTKADQKDYQTLSAELDEVLAALQDSSVSIDEAATLYQRGLELAKQLKAHIEAAENTITKLAATAETAK